MTPKSIWENKLHFMKIKNITLVLFIAVLLTACDAYQKVTYLQNAGKTIVFTDTISSPVPDAKLKIGDLLTIVVNSNTPEASIPFNLPLVPMQSMESYSQSRTVISSYGSNGGLQNYLVGTDGTIIFPIIGKLHVEGMTKNELAAQIKTKIYPRYIKEEPIVSIRFVNYSISVLGEVVRPNTYQVNNEKISIFEALATAGDLTIYGRRDNVLLIRQNNNGRETIRLDLRDKNLINSPYYYLQQNDVIYVQPNDPKSRSSQLSTAETLSVSLIGTLISLTSLIVTIAK